MPDLIDPPAPEAAETSTPSIFDNIASTIAEGGLDDHGNFKAEPPVPEAKPAVETPPTPVEGEKPPAAEEKKPEAAKDDEIDAVKPPDNMSEAASKNWDKLKDTSRNYKAKAVAAEGAIEELKTNFAAREAELLKQVQEASATSGELVELREKREAFEAAEKEFSVYAVTKTAEYKKTIEAPLMAIEDSLVKVAKRADISADDLISAVSERDEDRQSELLEALLPSLGTVDQGRVIRMAEDARSLILRDDEIRANAQTAQKELKERGEKETVAQREAAAKEYKASVKNTVDSLAQRLPFVELADGETKEGVFKSILDKAEAEDFDKSSPATKGTAAVAVIALERATRQLQKQTEYIATLEARVAEAAKSGPSLGGGDPPPPAREESGIGFLDSVDTLLGLQKSRTPAELAELMKG